MNRNRRQEKEDLDELKDPLLDDGDTRGIDDWEPISFGHSFDRLPGTPRLPFEKSLTKIAASWFVAVLFLGLLVCRLVTLVFKAVDETRCFFQIHSLQCRNFSIFNYFKEGNTTGWLCASVLTSAICLIALPTIPEFRGYKYAIRKFSDRSHFYSISFLLVCVLVYHALLMWRSEVPINRAIAGLFMSEKILATCTVFAFNFLRPPGSHDSYPALRVSYNASVVSALIENTYLFFRVSLDTTFQISSKEKFSQLDDSMNAIMVMLIAIEATFRWSLVSFFWSKLFHGRKDIFSNMNHLDDI